jgi:sulfane dehydrogenase subunit SoxC
LNRPGIFAGPFGFETGPPKGVYFGRQNAFLQKAHQGETDGLETTRSTRIPEGGAALASGLTVGAVAPAAAQGQASPASPAPSSPPMLKDNSDEIRYGARSKYVTSVRIPHGGRPTPDNFGLTFHVRLAASGPGRGDYAVLAPLLRDDARLVPPEIDPRSHTLMIHGLVDRPLTFTMDDLKRLPSVTRLHFIECAGNRHTPNHKTVQESHGMASCAEWTGRAPVHVAQGVRREGHGEVVRRRRHEEVKGASSMPIAKAMDDCILAYGMNGEAVRPQNGFPLRLMVPGFEGIFHTKWIRASSSWIGTT